MDRRPRRRSALRAAGSRGAAKESRPALDKGRLIPPTRASPGLRPPKDARFALSSRTRCPPIAREETEIEPRTAAPCWFADSRRASAAGPSGAAGGCPGALGGAGAVSPEPTVIVPRISSGWTVQTKVYVPACANVQLPLQEVPKLSTGTPPQLGFSGPPVQWTPWGTTLPGLRKATDPPGIEVTRDGFQANPLGVSAGSTAVSSAAPTLGSWRAPRVRAVSSSSQRPCRRLVSPRPSGPIRLAIRRPRPSGSTGPPPRLNKLRIWLPNGRSGLATFRSAAALRSPCRR